MKKNVFILVCLLVPMLLFSQSRKIERRPYIDQRKFHYGLVVGLHAQDLKFANNGFVTPTDESWFADVDTYSPGFTVGVLGELYLTQHLALRGIPTLHFGEKRIMFKEQVSGDQLIQIMKATYLSLAIDLKISGDRFDNKRPYFMVGTNVMYDTSSKKQQAILLKPLDVYLEGGIGCDFYLPYFKFIPELKFCFGLSNLLKKNRSDLMDPTVAKFSESIDKANARMIVLSFFIE